MSVDVKVSQSFQTQEQFVEGANNSLGGLVLRVSELGEDPTCRLYLEKDEALALASMLIEIANKQK